ncbi:MAG: DUF3224 domain-containing protein [Actinomycetota bacterium]|nr:DUF3224 domain-containing protein [Actinomycetota bacterium]
MRIRAAAGVLALAATITAPAVQAAQRETTQVRGGWVNDISFIPTSATPTSDPEVFKVDFTGGSLWDGDFTGRTVVHGTALMNITTGALTGTYTETFYGTYVPDGRTGSFTTRGTATSTEHLTFFARARIVSGTCGFAGSTGQLAYDGLSVHGGYVGRWAHPRTPPSSEPCLPMP